VVPIPHNPDSMVESIGRTEMQSLKLPTVVPGRQMNLLFENSRLEGLDALERNKVTTTLAQILMLAAGVRVEELDDDKR
jgi:hypothetical protein